jgi:hypothetical protein
MPKFLLYLPYSEFIDPYENKALGAIPLAFQRAGYDSHLIVGIMKSQIYKKSGVKIHETGNLDLEFTSTDNGNRRIPNGVKNFLTSKN